MKFFDWTSIESSINKQCEQACSETDGRVRGRVWATELGNGREIVLDFVDTNGYSIRVLAIDFGEEEGRGLAKAWAHRDPGEIKPRMLRSVGEMSGFIRSFFKSKQTKKVIKTLSEKSILNPKNRALK